MLKWREKEVLRGIQLIKGIRKRPYTPVHFTGSTLSLESLGYDVALTNDQVVTFNENNFAEAASPNSGALTFWSKPL